MIHASLSPQNRVLLTIFLSTDLAFIVVQIAIELHLCLKLGTFVR